MTQAECINLPEPELLFSPDGEYTSPYPVTGLKEFHPFDSRTSRPFTELKPFVVLQSPYFHRFEGMWKDLTDGYSPPRGWEDSDVDFPPFRDVFRISTPDLVRGEEASSKKSEITGASYIVSLANHRLG